MDERLQKALDFSNYMVTLNNQKRLLQERYAENLMYYTNGCQFSVTKELITFIGLLVEKGNTEVVLTDDNNIPTNINDLESFYEDITDVYFSASNQYFNDYQKLKTNRSVEKLIDYDSE